MPPRMALSSTRATVSSLLRREARRCTCNYTNTTTTTTTTTTYSSSSSYNTKAHLGHRNAAVHRQYHSSQHPSPSESPGVAEDAILSAALRRVPVTGFTEETLALGARDAGYIDATTSLFPDGPFSIVLHHLRTERQKLSSSSSSIITPPAGEPPHITASKWRERTRELCIARLRGNEPIIHHWQDALALKTIPSNTSVALTELAKLADEICYLAGDKSVDTDWYARRAGVAAAYVAAEAYMTQDSSVGFVRTYDFVGRSIEDMGRVKGFVEGFGDFVSFGASGLVNGLRSKGWMI